jgi:hypothetical protein
MAWYDFERKNVLNMLRENGKFVKLSSRLAPILGTQKCAFRIQHRNQAHNYRRHPYNCVFVRRYPLLARIIYERIEGRSV